MIESFLAPEDLTSARDRLDERARRLVADAGLQRVEIGADAPARELQSLESRAGSDGPLCLISEFRLWAWSPDDLRRLAAVIGDDGVLLFCEPTADLGWRRVVHRLSRRPLRAWLGYHFESDVPASLRTTGLVVGTMDRFTLGRAGLRSYVWGRAEHFARPPADEPGSA